MAAVAWDLEAELCEPCASRERRGGLRLVGPDAVRHARARPGVPAGVYRRRRLVAVAVAVAVATVVVLVMAAAMIVPGAPAAPSAQPATAGSAAEPVTVVVAPGETLWDIAAPYAPAGTEPMAYVVQIAAYNGVDPRAVQPGTVLQLPPPAN